jgi:glycosyltransferase involved in cell wall biosynthesis
MHVALVATYPPAACGIGTYTARLGAALAQVPGVRVTVLAEQAEGAAAEPGVIRAWHRRGDWVRGVLEAARELRPDVVHVQHEEAILGQDGRMIELCRELTALGIASAVSLHSVYAGGLGWLPGRWAPVRFQRELGGQVGRVIVHQHRGGREWLVAQGLPADKVTVIHHGTELSEPLDRAQARAALGFGADDKIVLSVGFIHRRKGIHTLVRAFPRVVDAVPNARLVIAGKPAARTPLDAVYRRWLEHLMAPGNGRWLDYRPGFHAEPVVAQLLAAADLVALAYRQRYGSASGILHTALGAGKPVICADQLKFAEAHDAWGDEPAGMFPHPDRPAAWSAAISRALTDDDVYARLVERAHQLARATRWSVVAAEHVEVYTRVVGELRATQANVVAVDRPHDRAARL